MTSHIFIAMGMWDDLVAANSVAVEMESKGQDGAADNYVVGHYSYWLMYGLLQQGRIQEAREILATARARLDGSVTQGEKRYYGAMYARFISDSGDETAADEFAAPIDAEIPSPHYHFARAATGIADDDEGLATRHIDLLNAIEGGSPEVAPDEAVVAVMRKQLDALSKLAGSDTDGAIALLQETVQDAANLPFHFGPPEFVKPPLELLADILSNAGRYEEAIDAYERQLEQSPLRASSLSGLGGAASVLGDADKARDAYRRLAEIWHSADPVAPGIDEVMRAVKAGD